MHLYEALAARVDEWRTQDYAVADYPLIADILAWCKAPEGTTFRLRDAQVRALETYWYLRLEEKTPRIEDLYSRIFEKKDDLLKALGIPDEAFKRADYELDALIKSIKADDAFVREFRLEAARETLTLAYPSYIFALAMGAGKTALIGAIIATEFAMALEYPDASFVENALVFAPGKTIIESLRQLTEIPYDAILPARLYKDFAASVKVTFTRDGEKDIPVIRGSSFNLVVTNTEKIRIQKESILKSAIGGLFTPEKEDEARQEIANRRLQAIASLPHLAIFSDEAHHTYGQALETELKKVRKTVDYLADNTNVVCVVNTTGTPYYRKQPLRDVVIWYGLSQGIRDGILKELSGNIKSYSFDDDVEAYLSHVIQDFFGKYADVALPDGTPAKIAIYFPQTDDVEALRPVIERKLGELGLPQTLILEHHTRNENKDAFDRFRRSTEQRIALLVDRGVEGWDVPALFACALARKLKSSNNFVLQAASRCLRQVPGNRKPARVYLSVDNERILDQQLLETYGETIAELNQSGSKSLRETIRLRKLNIPPLLIKQVVRTVVKGKASEEPLRLTVPDVSASVITETIMRLSERKAAYGVLEEVGDAVEIVAVPQVADIRAVAVELSGIYRLDLWTIYDELRRVYGDEADIPKEHIAPLAEQIEAQTRNYVIHEETVEKALALIRIDKATGEPVGWKKETEGGEVAYTAEISYPVDKQNLLVKLEDWKDRAGEFAFHYDPYNFDSNPEVAFLERLLADLQTRADEIEDVLFTGAITDPKKTDFHIDYKGEDGKYHSYSPDFIIRRKDGRCLIVEIKNAQFEAGTREDLSRYERNEAAVTVEGRKAVAVKELEKLNPDRLKYEIIFAGDTLAYDQTKPARDFIEEK